MASVLLIEDESLIRMMVADMLTELGHSIAGEAPDLATGLTMATEAMFDAAVLDVQLGAHNSEPIAQALHNRGIPFAFASGYGADRIPDNFKGGAVLQKPFQIEALERCMASLLANKRP